MIRYPHKPGERPLRCEECGCPNLICETPAGPDEPDRFPGEFAIACMDCRWSIWWHESVVVGLE